MAAVSFNSALIREIGPAAAERPERRCCHYGSTINQPGFPAVPLMNDAEPSATAEAAHSAAANWALCSVLQLFVSGDLDG